MASPLNLSKQFKQEIDDILGSAEPGTLVIHCSFKSRSNPTFFLEVRIIEEMHIRQDFVSEYCDITTLALRLKPEEYMELYDNSQGLFCNVQLYKSSAESQQKGDPIGTISDIGTHKKSSPINLGPKMVIIKDRHDLRRKYSPGLLVPTENQSESEHHQANSIYTELELIDQEAYYARKVKFNSILRDVTIEDTLLLVAKMLGFDKAYIYPPDNKKKYTNLVIPPMLGVNSIFKYLQEARPFGIYNEGLAYYITNGSIFIYPAYKTDIKSPYTMNIYNLGENQYIGLEGYHITKGLDYFIVSNTGSDVKSLLYEHLENHGSSYLLHDNDYILDRFIVAKEREFDISKNSIVNVSLATVEGMVKDAYTPTFVAKGNVFSSRSMLAVANTSLVAIGWTHAVPYSCRPGTKFNFICDTEKGPKVYTGQCAKIIYSIYPVNAVGKKLYTCSSNMKLITVN